MLVLIPDVMAIVEGAQDAAEGTESIGGPWVLVLGVVRESFRCRSPPSCANRSFASLGSFPSHTQAGSSRPVMSSRLSESWSSVKGVKGAGWGLNLQGVLA